MRAAPVAGGAAGGGREGMRNGVRVAVKIQVALLACTCLLLLPGGEAWACTGVPDKFHFHPAADYWNSPAVFTGTVVEIVEAPVEHGDGSGKQTYVGRVARFRVEEAFRGVAGETVDVTSGQSSMCVYDYRQGETYFVYAHPSAGRLSSSIFSRTRPAAAAAEDLAYARDVARGEAGGRVFGLVQKLSRRHARDWNHITPVVGAAVTVSGVGGHWEATTDARGQFEVRGVPRGRYRVRAKLAEKIRVAEFEETVEVWPGGGGQYAGVVFNATSLGVVTGRVVGAGRAPVPRLKLELLPAGAGETSAASPAHEAISNDEGEFTFDDVAPGGYLLAVDPANHVGRDLPAYPRSYYPGAAEAARATVIKVGENEVVRARDFRVPPPLKERTFAGVVVAGDGTPEAGALVSLYDLDGRGPSPATSSRADEGGRFALKGYEGFRYCVRAISDGATSPHTYMFSSAVRLPASGDVRDLRLAISPGGRMSPCHESMP